MSPDILLPIFPTGSLSESVITTVWIGMWVIVFFNQWLGWPLSGLIVPGYLVPLMVLKPLSASVIMIEAVVTYLLAWLLFRVLPRRGWWFSVFGRDRFFILVLFSVVVRIVFDAWLLPLFIDYLELTWRIPFSYKNQLHSFGLIIVALLANQFWKPGLVRGMIPVGITLLVSYVLVRFVLLNYTNFTISSIEYLYEDVAGNILAAPKAYIILLTAAFIASRMNLLYGWEFNGILIPSLLALLWYQPAKLAISLMETVIVMGLAHLVLSLPIFKQVTIEGGRKILLFFNVAFAYKFALGYFLIYFYPTLKVTDFFGFGYLITTLMAVKMYEKQIFMRLTRATFQVSFVAALLANMVGYFLTMLPRNPEPDTVVTAPVTRRSGNYKDVIQQDKLQLYQAHLSLNIREPNLVENDKFGQTIRNLLKLPANSEHLGVKRARETLDQINYSLTVLDDRYFYLREKTLSQGWGIYVIDTQAKNELMINVPAPLDEWMTMEAALILAEKLGARAVAVNGISAGKTKTTAIDPVNSYQSLLSTFYREAGLNEVLHIRGLSNTQRDRMSKALKDYDPEKAESLLFVKSLLPESLNLGALENLIGSYRSYWADAPGPNLHRDMSSHGFTELYLSKQGLRQTLALETSARQIEALGVQQMEGMLKKELLADEGYFARAGSDLYQPPSPEEMIYFNDEVYEPLAQIAFKFDLEEPETREQELEIIADRAASIGYEVVRFSDEQTQYIMLREREGEKRHYWGTYILRMGQADAFVIQVPRPIYERNTFDFGLSTFFRLNARAFLLSGAHPHANDRLIADPIEARNINTIFNQVHQTLVRYMIDDETLICQIRALGYRENEPYTRSEALLATDHPMIPIENLTQTEYKFLKLLEQDNLSYNFVDGSPDTIGYGVGAIPQSEFLRHVPNTRFMLVWVNPNLRRSYATQTDNQRIRKQMVSLQLSQREMDQVLAISNSGSALNKVQFQKLTRYLKFMDITALHQLQRDKSLRCSYILDEESEQLFLLITNQQEQPLVLANLVGRVQTTPAVINPNNEIQTQIQRFIEQRNQLLLWRPRP